MHCKQARQQIHSMLPSAEASSALKQHLLPCKPCREIFEVHQELLRSLARFRAETDSAGPSAIVEQRIFAALRSHDKLRPAVNPWRWIAASIPVAAAVGIVTLFTPIHRSVRKLPVQSAVTAPAEEPFVAVPYVIPPAPYERTSVVRTRVSLQMMLAAGFDIPQEDMGMSAPADVLYGEDGRMLAIRLLQDSNDSEKRMD